MTKDTEALREAVEQVKQLAQRDMARTQTDFIGRMGQELCDFEAAIEPYPDGELPDDVRGDAYDAISGLAGLAFAQMLMLRGCDHTIFATPASDPDTIGSHYGNGGGLDPVAGEVAPVGDYHVTSAQYEAAVKGRQDFRQAYREQLNLLSQKEWAAVAQIGADQELSTSAVLRQAVRLYQMHLYRLKAGETLSWSGDEQRAKDFAGPLYAHPPHPAPVDSDEAVRLLRGIVRLSEMGFEASMREPEEDGNYAVYIRAKAFLDGHPSSVALSDALRDIPDEVYRHIAESKDVAHARSRVADLVAQLPLTTPVDPVAGGEALREALRRAALRLEICAGYIDSSFGLSGTRRAERAMKAKHFALEALAALKGPAA